mmetsp:Transcript_28608/g.66521  ORF Transcript_28608/g.66521 Transcript_28608/m.66521 type:complete len:460 (-) Transcript_28608:100-1479(-)
MNTSISQRGSLGASSSASNVVLQTQAAAAAAAGLGTSGLGQTGFGTTATSNTGMQLGSQLGGQLGSQLGSNLPLGGQLGSQLGSGLGGQLNSGLGNQLGTQLPSLGAPSLLDVQRAENILAAAAMASNNANSMASSNTMLANMMNVNAAANQQALLQSRLGTSLLGNTQLHNEALFAKNQALSLATAHGGFGATGGMFNQTPLFEQDLQGRLKRRRSSSAASDDGCGKHKRLSGGAGDMKLAAELVALEDSSPPQQRSSAAEQVQQLLKLREDSNVPKSRRKAKTFPVKLMQALMENPNEDAVAWLPDGKSFVIVQPDLFVESVLKKVFKECKYASFVRKLHRWGFVRLTSGTGTDCFHHPLFQKNRMEMCSRIVCTPRDSNKVNEAEKRAAAAAQQQNAGDKPPSLAGVEKFFRTKVSTATKPEVSGEEREQGGEREERQGDSQDMQLGALSEITSSV